MPRIDFGALEQETLAKLPEGGTIAKGGPQKARVDEGTGKVILKNGKPQMIQGDDLDHFRLIPADVLRGVDFDGRPAVPPNDMASLMEQRWLDVYGPEPRHLNILFLGATIKDVYRYANSVWATPKAGGRGFMLRECDGTTITQEMQETPAGLRMYRNPTDDQGQPKRCACLNEKGEEIAQKCPLGCMAKAQLTVVLPDLGIPRQFNFRTGGINDIREIMRNLRPHDGALNATPFRLVRTEKEVPHVKEDGTTIRVKKWVCHVELALTSGIHFLQAQADRRFNAIVAPPMLEAVEVIEPGWSDIASELPNYMVEDMPPPAVKPDTKPATKTSGKPRKKTLVTPPATSEPASAEVARQRAEEVSARRTALGHSTEDVRAMIAQYPQAIDPAQAATHPGQLSEADYQALLEQLQPPAAGAGDDEPQDAEWRDAEANFGDTDGDKTEPAHEEEWADL